MSEYKSMSARQLQDFIAVTKVAIRRAKERNDSAVVAIAEQDIDDAATELSSR